VCVCVFRQYKFGAYTSSLGDDFRQYKFTWCFSCSSTHTHTTVILNPEPQDLERAPEFEEKARGTAILSD